MVLLAEAHAPELDEQAADIRIDQLLRYRNHALTPSMNVKDAVARLEQAGADALAVVDEAEKGRVLGLLSEAHALRRYSEELDRRRRELVGEVR
jgi:CIC family chloride channel protein